MNQLPYPLHHPNQQPSTGHHDLRTCPDKSNPYPHNTVVYRSNPHTSASKIGSFVTIYRQNKGRVASASASLIDNVSATARGNGVSACVYLASSRHSLSALRYRYGRDVALKRPARLEVKRASGKWQF